MNSLPENMIYIALILCMCLVLRINRKEEEMYEEQMSEHEYDFWNDPANWGDNRKN